MGIIMKFNRILATVTATVLTSCLFLSGMTTTTVLADDVNDDFDPYVFYHEILNEKRPDDHYHPKGYRFIDLDNDGKEELIITGVSYIVALYTYDYETNQPKEIFLQTDDTPHWYIGYEGTLHYFPGNMRGEYYGYIKFKLQSGNIIPFYGYLHHHSYGYLKTENKELLTIPFDDKLLSWDKISVEEFNSGYYQTTRKSSFMPWVESFSTYDVQQEFDKNNSEKPLNVTGRYGYDEFLQRYKNYISSVKYEDMSVGSIGMQYLSTDKYSEELRTYTYEKRSDHCFILRDLNGDGIRELITGGLKENGEFQFFDLYTIYDGEIIHLAASANNHRTNFYLNENDEIVYSLNGGAANQLYEVFDISKGSLALKGVLQLENQKYYNYENFGTASENKKEIDQKVYEEILKERYSGKLQQDVVMLKDWHPETMIDNEPGETLRVTGQYGYDELLHSYKTVLDSRSYSDTIFNSVGIESLETDNYSVLLREYIFRNETKWCFILKDFNRDGTPDLATGCLENNGDFTLFDVYTIYDSKIIHLAAAATRTRFYLTDNNEIVEHASGGAFNGWYKAYEIYEDSLVVKRALLTENGKHYEYNDFGTTAENRIEINQNEYDKLVNEQYTGELKQDVLAFKDWQPGMLIGETISGDINSDGRLDASDIILIHKHILSMSGETVVDTSYADINKDNTVNVLDLMLLKNLILTQ